MERDLLGFDPAELRRMAAESVRVGDLVDAYEREHPGTRIDTAVPWEWLAEAPEERRHYVWLYDEVSRYFGRPLDLRPLIGAAIERKVSEWRAECEREGWK